MLGKKNVCLLVDWLDLLFDVANKIQKTGVPATRSKGDDDDIITECLSLSICSLLMYATLLKIC